MCAGPRHTDWEPLGRVSVARLVSRRIMGDSCEKLPALKMVERASSTMDNPTASSDGKPDDMGQSNNRVLVGSRAIRPYPTARTESSRRSS